VKSRRDQVQAHAFVMGRLTAALVHGEPDAPESPMRRTSLGSFGGVMLGALAVAGFLIWGLISPASTPGKFTAGELVVVKQTGSRYIFARGELHPVLNWSSAMLLENGKTTFTSLSATSLAHTPQGQPLGIVGAPDDLPAQAALNKGSWLVCSQFSDRQPQVALAVGVRKTTSLVPPGYAVIVRTPDGSQYLVYGGDRMRLDAPWIATALGLGRAPVIDVSAAWLNAVPAGADLRPLPVADRGTTGPVLGGRATRVGEVLADSNVGSASQFYLVVSGGVTPISATQAAVLLTDPATIPAYRGATATPISVSPAAIATANIVGESLPDGAGAPSSPPSSFPVSGSQVPCTEYAVSGDSTRSAAPEVVFAASLTGVPPGQGLTDVTVSPESAGLVEVAPGGGAFVRPQAAPGVSADSLFLVTDAGVKYPIPSATAATALGYQARRAARLPAALLGLLPTGPALDLPALRG
jgi:type VII secretion protein EccB